MRRWVCKLLKFFFNISCHFSFHLPSLAVKRQSSCGSEILAIFKELPVLFFVTILHSRLNFHEKEVHIHYQKQLALAVCPAIKFLFKT